ncbi:MAG TPA: dienelactone hydrolase family protein [Candidatus Sulfomarinibacteraceae bacterium]|nr:dienelactone hydrolase family protein [Candidatus Sulfomarinibacteraceae bacterium]
MQETSIKTTMIAFPHNEHETPAYLARPDDDSASHPGVVVLQEWWGLVPHIKDVAERFAREGFVALAPDLYHGAHAEEPDEARKLAMALDRQRAVDEIRSAVRYLQQLDPVQPSKVGVVGWCMGGGLALSTAADDDNVGAVVAFYGSPLAASDVSRIEAPVLGLYAGQDRGIPVAVVHEFEDALQQHRVPHEIHIYPNTHHAFFNDTREVYDQDASADAWERTLAWFRQHLQ